MLDCHFLIFLSVSTFIYWLLTLEEERVIIFSTHHCHIPSFQNGWSVILVRSKFRAYYDYNLQVKYMRNVVTIHCQHNFLMLVVVILIFLELINFINCFIRFVFGNPSWTLWQLSNLSLRQWDASCILRLSFSRRKIFWSFLTCSRLHFLAGGPFITFLTFALASHLLPGLHKMSGFFAYMTTSSVYSFILVEVISLESRHGSICLEKMLKYD